MKRTWITKKMLALPDLFCKCGCGEKVYGFKYRAKGVKERKQHIKGHRYTGDGRKRLLDALPNLLCKCGCGTPLDKSVIYKMVHSSSFKPKGFIRAHINRGEHSSFWRGGRSITATGYIQIHAPDHPYATTRKYVFEHRLVMEKHIGRYMLPSEEIHHLNGIKDDNRIENLVIITKSDHTKYHKTGCKFPNRKKPPKQSKESYVKGWETRRKNKQSH